MDAGGLCEPLGQPRVRMGAVRGRHSVDPHHRPLLRPPLQRPAEDGVRPVAHDGEDAENKQKQTDSTIKIIHRFRPESLFSREQTE